MPLLLDGSTTDVLLLDGSGDALLLDATDMEAGYRPLRIDGATSLRGRVSISQGVRHRIDRDGTAHRRIERRK